jgi:glycosyltransferase involved in cell wall biosynthesis
MQRLAIITTHPVQYYAPIFQLIQSRERIEIKVFYTAGESGSCFDRDFGKDIVWDLPLLSGYAYEWAVNKAKDPGTHHFNGVITPGLEKQVMDWDPHVVLIIGWAYRSHLSALRYFKNKVPVLFRGDSTLLDERGGLRSGLKKIALSWIYRHIDLAFYTGQQNKSYYLAYGVPEKKLIFAPHAVDNERFHYSEKGSVNLIRQQLMINDHDILVLFAGKFTKKKNPLALLKAFQQLGKPSLHLLFAGNGVLEDELMARSADNKHIHFMGFQNQSMMPALYQAADLFCLPSSGPGESWGLAVNEAMAAGKAVLVSNKAGCAADLVKNDINGAVFDSHSTESLSSALDGLTLGRKRLMVMGKRSHEIIEPWSFLAIAVALERAVLNFGKI